MRVVLLQGTFELINAGHVRELKRCREQGDYLIVALNTNRLVRAYKRRAPVLPWSQKKEILEAIRWVDKVVPANGFSPMKLLKKYKVDVYCCAPEWVNTKQREFTYMLENGKNIFITEEHNVVRTRDIKKTLLEEARAGA